MSTLSQFFGSGGGAAGAPGTGQVTFFRENGSVTIPSNATYVAYGVLGAGGGACIDSPGNKGGSGAGGGFSYKEVALTLPAPITVTATVGAGGTPCNPYQTGSSGGTSCLASPSPAWTTVCATGGAIGCNCTVVQIDGGVGSGGDINANGGTFCTIPGPLAIQGDFLNYGFGGSGAGGLFGPALDFDPNCGFNVNINYNLDRCFRDGSGGAYSANTGVAGFDGLLGKAGGTTNHSPTSGLTRGAANNHGENAWVQGYTRDGRLSTSKTFFGAAGGGGGKADGQPDGCIAAGNGGAGAAGGVGTCCSTYGGQSGFGAGAPGGGFHRGGLAAGCGGGGSSGRANFPSAVYVKGGDGMAVVEFWETS